MVTALAEAAGRETLHFRIRFDEARPRPEEVEVVLGYTAGRVPEVVQEAVGELLASPEKLWSIEGGCVVYPSARVDRAAHRIQVEAQSFETGKIVAGQLDRAEGVAVFLCTAGPGVEGLSRGLMSSGDPFKGYVADTVGSLVVEKAMDEVQDRLESLMLSRGLRITNRYSPGYCGWKVDEQQKLFRLLPHGFCGVTLTESSLMRPVKSVSGLIGIGAAVRRAPYTCKLCDLEDCLYRRRQQPPPEAA